ncbi:HD-GYP domain-containing protein [Robertmurraya kyonggiensis]|uniref:HD-GYP domain-containing protein n=1 Tax=Robertmurraya kyonggiensis TaxID=1037680 RepID=A0A4U1CZQ6_9BACI|nr:HD-GYP domain-containing protein [Robertmurraya kyonggiensis]TKC15341.1 HD-GYP domain-containing protein [Robertmurraya kyonggiensis]
MFNTWLSYPKYFRYSFFLLLSLGIVLNGFIFENESNMYLLYILSVVFLGIGFYNSSALLIILLTTIVVICRFYLIPDEFPTITTFFTYLLTYLLVSFISRALMRFAQKVRNDHLELTTALANALNSRDPYTRHHSEKVSKYGLEIAKEMELSAELCDVIRIGGLLHDIGKIGIPEDILTKKGKLTEEEYNIIKSHTRIGYKIIQHISNFAENGVLDIVLYHHERYDGRGYPSGLKGKEIPLVARIIAVADTFDAMTSNRVYRKKLDFNSTLNTLQQNKGTQFDPEIVDVLLRVLERKK